MADCEKLLSEKDKLPSESATLDPRISLQVTSAANRIAGESLWKQAPAALKINSDIFKSEFMDKKTSLKVFFNHSAEVQGYIQTKNKKTTYWCMKDK